MGNIRGSVIFLCVGLRVLEHMHLCVFCMCVCVCVCMCLSAHICGSRQRQGQTDSTYSFCNKAVRSIRIFISSLFTFSSDNTCQISPRDFLKKYVCLPRSCTPATATKQQELQQTTAAVPDFLSEWLVNITSCTALQIDGTRVYIFPI